jgi:toxin ParE1/3/4
VDFGEQIFGLNIANIFLLNVQKNIKTLSTQYQFHPENKFLPTKTKIYRNIILGKYMILYRIKPTTVEVLAIYHSSIKPSKIKKLRNVKP